MDNFTFKFRVMEKFRFCVWRSVLTVTFLVVASSLLAQVYSETSYKLSDDKTVLESWKGDETEIDMNSILVFITIEQPKLIRNIRV